MLIKEKCFRAKYVHQIDVYAFLFLGGALLEITRRLGNAIFSVISKRYLSLKLVQRQFGEFLGLNLAVLLMD
jgi:hypothetical protein